MKDAFITMITNMIKVKTNRQKSSGREVGPSSLGTAVTPTANNMGVELPGSIGLHPLEQQSLLWGSHI